VKFVASATPTPGLPFASRHAHAQWPMTLLLITAASLLSPLAMAQSAASLYKEADLPLGEKLLREHRCAECHSRRVGGDGAAIYRPQGRINTPGALRGMVETCNLELNLTLFPDEVTSISAVLNRDHYHFK